MRLLNLTVPSLFALIIFCLGAHPTLTSLHSSHIGAKKLTGPIASLSMNYLRHEAG
jgi:hypothetical protein